MKIKCPRSGAANDHRYVLFAVTYCSNEIWESVPIAERGSVNDSAFGGGRLSAQIPRVQII
jgi:hypothetical protein